MPTVAIVEGIRIVFYANDHPPAHFHVEFAEHRAAIDLATMTIRNGSLPPPRLRAVLAWATPRKDVLTEAFSRDISKQRLERLK